MKRSFVILLVCLAAASCSPLRIVMNSQSPEGGRTVLTSDKHLFGNLDVALGAHVFGKDTTLAVLITYDGNSTHGVFDRNDRLLVRFDDQSVLTLTNIYDKEYEVENTTDYSTRTISDFGYAYTYDPYFDAVYVSPYEVSRMVPVVTNRRVTRSYALYLISKPELEKLASGKIIKLRVEIEDRELDMKDPGGLEDMFAQMKQLLFDCLRKGISRSDF